MTIFAVQYLESDPDLRSYSPEKVRQKLQTACGILPISIIILGWNVPQQLVEVCAKEVQRVQAKLYRWQPLLTDDGELKVETSFQVTGLSGKPVAGHLDMPEFSFMCPNNPDVRERTMTHLEEIHRRGIYDGIFLDRIRFPALSNDPYNNLGCFCSHCQKQA